MYTCMGIQPIDRLPSIQPGGERDTEDTTRLLSQEQLVHAHTMTPGTLHAHIDLELLPFTDKERQFRVSVVVRLLRETSLPINCTYFRISGSVKSFDGWPNPPPADSGTSDKTGLNKGEQVLLIRCLHRVLPLVFLPLLKKDVKLELLGKVAKVFMVRRSALQSQPQKEMKKRRVIWDGQHKKCVVFRPRGGTAAYVMRNSKPSGERVCSTISHSSGRSTSPSLYKVNLRSTIDKFSATRARSSSCRAFSSSFASDQGASCRAYLSDGCLVRITSLDPHLLLGEQSHGNHTTLPQDDRSEIPS